MSLTQWSRAVALSLFALAAPALAAEEGGAKVVIKLASGEMPEPQKVVAALEAVGDTGEKQVKVQKTKSPAGQELTLELWGPFVPAAEAAAALRAAFPALASADIQASALTERPAVDELRDGVRTVLPDGRVKVEKKVIKQQ